MSDYEKAFRAKVDTKRARVVLVGNRQAFALGFRLMWMAVVGAIQRRHGIDFEFGETP